MLSDRQLAENLLEQAKNRVGWTAQQLKDFNERYCFWTPTGYFLKLDKGMPTRDRQELQQVKDSYVRDAQAAQQEFQRALKQYNQTKGGLSW